MPNSNLNKISNKKKFKGNPRFISKEDFELLKEHLSELGDLSGVVYCQNNKAYVGGNQRSEVFNNCTIEIIEKYDEPTKNKTLAHGFIHFNDEKFAYREVFFSELEFKKACIVANNDGGDWDWDILANEFDHDLLVEWGMNTPDKWKEDEEENQEAIKEEKFEFKIICNSDEELKAVKKHFNTDKKAIEFDYLRFD